MGLSWRRNVPLGRFTGASRARLSPSRGGSPRWPVEGRKARRVLLVRHNAGNFWRRCSWRQVPSSFRGIPEKNLAKIHVATSSAQPSNSPFSTPPTLEISSAFHSLSDPLELISSKWPESPPLCKSEKLSIPPLLLRPIGLETRRVLSQRCCKARRIWLIWLFLKQRQPRHRTWYDAGC